jgi:mercuric ion transport protein
MSDKSDSKLIATGIIGTVIVALCCFTPVLLVLLVAVGVSTWLGWIDYVLLPALAFFIALTLYAVWRRQRRHANQRNG